MSIVTYQTCILRNCTLGNQMKQDHTRRVYLINSRHVPVIKVIYLPALLWCGNTPSAERIALMLSADSGFCGWCNVLSANRFSTGRITLS